LTVSGFRGMVSKPLPLSGGPSGVIQPIRVRQGDQVKAVMAHTTPVMLHLCSFPVHPLGLLCPIHRKLWTPYTQCLTVIH